MNFDIKLSGIQQAQDRFDPKKVERAARATVNKVAKAGKTAASDLIRNELKINLRQSDLDRKFEVKPASGSVLKAVLVVLGAPIRLTYFNAQSTSGGIRTMAVWNKGGGAMIGLAQRKMRGKGTGRVQVEIIKGKKTVLSPRTFIGKGQGGVTLVFYRTHELINKEGKHGKKQGEKLRSLMMYRETSMFSKRIVMDKVKGRIIEQWNKEWANQIRQLQSGQGWTQTE
jgi:hypothetical protein